MFQTSGAVVATPVTLAAGLSRTGASGGCGWNGANPIGSFHIAVTRSLIA